MEVKQNIKFKKLNHSNGMGSIQKSGVNDGMNGECVFDAVEVKNYNKIYLYMTFLSDFLEKDRFGP